MSDARPDALVSVTLSSKRRHSGWSRGPGGVVSGELTGTGLPPPRWRRTAGLLARQEPQGDGAHRDDHAHATVADQSGA